MSTRQKLGLVLLLALTAWSLSAPAPLPRPRKPRPVVLEGQWVLHWSGSPYAVTFSPDGSCRMCCGTGCAWVGSWAVGARTLFVHERLEQGEAWVWWTVELDEDLAGETRGAYTGIRVRLERPR